MRRSNAPTVVSRGLLLLAASSLAIMGCQTITTDKFPDSADPATEISKTEELLKDARVRQVDVLSPDSYADAAKFHSRSKARLDNNDDAEDTLDAVAKSRAYLERANQSAKATGGAMPEVVEAREMAIKADAGKHAKNEFTKVDKALVSLTKYHEGDDEPKIDVKERDRLKNEYMSIELGSIKTAKLNAALVALEQAKREDAQNVAPRSFAEARNSLRVAEAFIEANRRDSEGIDSVSAKAVDDSEHLLLVTRAAKAIGGENAEAVVLERERLQGRLATEEARSADAEAALEATEAEVAAARVEMGTLEAEKEFNERFDRVKSMFTANEGEVYREGNRLVLRLQALSFASGKADLGGDNYDLLNRVRDSVNSFAPAAVVVEGHTDSTGSRATNERLSLARAKAVEAYLRANGLADEGVTIESRGLGDSRPLAPNNTAEGRAKNRRVDVIITPDMSAVSH